MREPSRNRGVDEFEAIARLLRPLAEGAPESLELKDDAALIPGRPGFDLVISTDAMVEGVHFLAGDPPDLVARKLLRVNLSDLAAKGAEPYGYLLAAAWPSWCDWPVHERFVAGLKEDQARYGLKLLGGDTSSTPGPLTLAATILGWTPKGRMVRRSGARIGDRILVSGVIGDGFLGLKAAVGEIDSEALAERYRLPAPRVELIDALRAHASAACDVSDGLIADVGHIGEASGVAVRFHLDRMPLSDPARRWLEQHKDRPSALGELASGGDDYEIACTVPPAAVAPMLEAADKAGVAVTEIGEVIRGEGIEVLLDGARVIPARTGWRHR